MQNCGASYEFGFWLKQVLKKKKIKQKELAKLSEVSEPYISQILAGKRSSVRIETIIVLCESIQVDGGMFLMKCIIEKEMRAGSSAEHLKFNTNHLFPMLPYINGVLGL